MPLGYQDYFHNFGDLDFYIFISNNCLIIKVSFEIKKIYKIMKNNLDTPVAKQCRALYTKYRTRTYVRPIKSGPQKTICY